MSHFSTLLVNGNVFDHSVILQLSLFSGNVIGFCLYGALTVQLYIYHIYFPKDPWRYKAVIYTVYLCEAVYTTALTYDLGRFFLAPSTYNPCLSTLVIPVCGGIVAVLTEGMYAHRIGIITSSKLLSWGIIAVITIQLVVSAILIGCHIAFKTVALSWAALCLAVDLTIAVTMVQSLSKEEILSKRFKRNITRLLYIIVGTGVLTAAVNVATLTVALAAPDAVYVPAIVLSKIYANSMMVLVNNRLSFAQSDYTIGEMPTVDVNSLHAATRTMTTDVESQGQPDSKEFAAEMCRK